MRKCSRCTGVTKQGKRCARRASCHQGDDRRCSSHIGRRSYFRQRLSRRRPSSRERRPSYRERRRYRPRGDGRSLADDRTAVFLDGGNLSDTPFVVLKWPRDFGPLTRNNYTAQGYYLHPSRMYVPFSGVAGNEWVESRSDRTTPWHKFVCDWLARVNSDSCRGANDGCCSYSPFLSSFSEWGQLVHSAQLGGPLWQSEDMRLLYGLALNSKLNGNQFVRAAKHVDPQTIVQWTSTQRTTDDVNRLLYHHNAPSVVQGLRI